MIAFFLLLCLLDLVVFSAPVLGQNTTAVTTVSGPAYARSGSNLYVVGGGYEREVMTSTSRYYNTPSFVVGDGQFIVLDLSVSWKGSAPAWRKLKNGPKQYNFPGAVSADGSKMVTFHSGDSSPSFAMLYDVKTDTWSSSKVQVPLGNRTGVGAVLNPLDGQVYLPSGYENTLGDQLYVYNFDTDTMNKSQMSGPLTDALYYNGVWDSKTQTMLFFGGRVYPSGSYAPESVSVYTPSTGLWSSLVTTGSGPGARTDHCIAISDDGSKFVVMGGRNEGYSSMSYLSDLYILDLSTLVWTRAKDYSSPRTYAVCTIYNNTFISWGGGDSSSTVLSAPAILYDLKRQKYLSTYMGSNPDSDYDVTMGPQKGGSSTPNGSGSYSGSGDSSSSGGASVSQIAGGVFGGVAVLVILILACNTYRKRGNSAHNQQTVVLDVFKDGQLVSHDQNRTGAVGEVTFVGQAATQWLSASQPAQRGSTLQTTTTQCWPASPGPISAMNVGQPSHPHLIGQQPYPLLSTHQPSEYLPGQTPFSDVRPSTLEQRSPQGYSTQTHPLQHSDTYGAPPSYTDSPQLRSRQPEYVPQLPTEHDDGSSNSGAGSPMSWPMTVRSPELISQ